jgi:hypothetical protein
MRLIWTPKTKTTCAQSDILDNTFKVVKRGSQCQPITHVVSSLKWP